jgi:hypothetical protein
MLPFAANLTGGQFAVIFLPFAGGLLAALGLVLATHGQAVSGLSFAIAGLFLAGMACWTLSTIMPTPSIQAELH